MCVLHHMLLKQNSGLKILIMHFKLQLTSHLSCLSGKKKSKVIYVVKTVNK